jgi:hypothetical protein
VTLVLVEGVGRAAELVGGFLDGQEPIATRAGSLQRKEKCDDLGKERLLLLRREQPARAGSRARSARLIPSVSQHEGRIVVVVRARDEGLGARKWIEGG